MAKPGLEPDLSANPSVLTVIYKTTIRIVKYEKEHLSSVVGSMRTWKVVPPRPQEVAPVYIKLPPFQ